MRFLLESLFGINRRPLTLEATGADLGVTKERIRQLRDKGLLFLKQKIQENKLALEL